jgi:hypothetical protein
VYVPGRQPDAASFSENIMLASSVDAAAGASSLSSASDRATAASVGVDPKSGDPPAP